MTTHSIRGHDGRMTRRALLGVGSMAAAGLFVALGSRDALAETPKRIDIHAHLWNADYLDLVQSFGRTDTPTQRNRGATLDPGDIDKRFAMMDAAGVDLQVLSVSPQAPHFADKAHAVAAARKANDMYAEAVGRYPKRFKAFAALPMPHVDEALKELDRAIDQLKMAGVTLTNSILGRSIADPAFTPLFEELNRRGSVIFLHPIGDAIGSPLVADYHLTWMIGAPFEDTVALMHLILQGIPTRFPKLKIVNSHLGGALPVLTKRLDSITTWEYPAMPERPSVAVRRMWYDTVDYGDVPALRAAVDALGADRMVLGSDFPYETGDVYQLAVTYIANAGLKNEDVAAIQGGTAARMLGLT
jgi:6-methylsalicylate decarboxylase